MNIINNKTSSCKESKRLINVLRDILNKENKVSYDEFKEIVSDFVLKLMYFYLYRNDLLDHKKFNNYSFEIKDVNRPIDGVYMPFDTKIIIDEKCIKRLYNGEILALTSLFHELTHFKVDVDLYTHKPDFDLYRILKEDLLQISTIEEIDDFKVKDESKREKYYRSNYDLHSEEVYSNIISYVYLLRFLDYASISLDSQMVKYIKQTADIQNDNWNNYERNFVYVSSLNDNYLGLYDAFDFVIQYNKDWISEYPMLSYEYYLDNSGRVVKRNDEELLDILNEEESPVVKEFINDIIDQRRKLSLEKEKKLN